MESPNGRSEERPNVFLAAILQTDAHSLPVRIRNISTRGALVDGASLPSAGERVRLERADLSVGGHIAWQSDRFAGIRFTQAVQVDEWIAGTVHAGQRRVDAIVAALRSSEPVPGELEREQSDDTLDAISASLDEICERLVSMPNSPVELGEEILRLDALANALRNICEKRRA